MLKKNNPYVPVLIREALGVSPTLWVRYGIFLYLSGFLTQKEYGREENISLQGLSEEECKERVHSLLFGA